MLLYPDLLINNSIPIEFPNDGVHPNDNGYKSISHNIYIAIIKTTKFLIYNKSHIDNDTNINAYKYLLNIKNENKFIMNLYKHYSKFISYNTAD